MWVVGDLLESLDFWLYSVLLIVCVSGLVFSCCDSGFVWKVVGCWYGYWFGWFSWFLVGFWMRFVVKVVWFWWFGCGFCWIVLFCLWEIVFWRKRWSGCLLCVCFCGFVGFVIVVWRILSGSVLDCVFWFWFCCGCWFLVCGVGVFYLWCGLV